MLDVLKKPAFLLSVILLLATIGSALSYFGYQQSLQPLPTTQIHTVTSQQLNTSVESDVVTSTYMDVITSDVVSLERWESPSWIGCGFHLSYTRTLRAGPVHMSYGASKVSSPTYHPPIDFFLMRSATQTEYIIQPTVCGAGISYGRTIVFSKLSTREYDGMVNVPEAGEYEFAFFVQEGTVPGAALFTVRAEQMVTTVTTFRRTLTSSVDIAYETSSISLHPAGLGPSFYAGFSILLIAGMVFVVGAVFSTRKLRGRPALEAGVPAKVAEEAPAGKIAKHAPEIAAIASVPATPRTVKRRKERRSAASKRKTVARRRKSASERAGRGIAAA